VSKLFVISCCCVPETDAILLEFLLTLLEKQTSAEWQLGSDMSGDIAIYDIDEKAGLELYQQRLAASDGPVPVVFSTESPKLDAEFRLVKPMRSADFLATAKSIIEKYPDIGRETGAKEASSSETVEAANTSIATTVTKLKRPTVKRLYNLLTEDIEAYKNPVSILFREVSFYIDFSSKRFYCEHKLMLLSMLCKSDISKLNISEISSYELGKIETQMTARPLTELIWCCALLGSSGELIDSIDENTPLHLKRWPNLKSLVHLPRHITLTAFLSKHTATIDEIVKQTRVLPDNVIDFVNACKVMGYLDDHVSLDDVETKPVQTDKVKKGLFGKIRNKFGVKTG